MEAFKGFVLLEKGRFIIRHMDQAHVSEAVTSLYSVLKNEPSVITHVDITKCPLRAYRPCMTFRLIVYFICYKIFLQNDNKGILIYGRNRCTHRELRS